MLLSEEFQIGRINAREDAERVREIEMARAVHEEKARRRALRRATRNASAERTVPSGPVALPERGTPVVAAPQSEQRELQNAGR